MPRKKEVEIKNAFQALTKKKKKIKPKPTKNEEEEHVDEPVEFTAVDDWGDEADNVGNDAFYADDGFMVPTKVAKSRTVENQRPENPKEDEVYADTDDDSESDNDNDSEDEDPVVQPVVTQPVSKTVRKEPKLEEPEDLDAILEEMKIENDDTVVTSSEIKETEEETPVSSLDAAANELLANLIPGGDGKSKSKTKKKKKKKTQAQKKKSVKSARHLVEAEAKARLTKANKKKRDKTKFNQIPNHLA